MTDRGIAAERDPQVAQPDETSTHLQRDQTDGAVAPDDETAERQIGDSGDDSRGAAPDDVGAAALPQVTFPEASVRDPETEAADLERRRSVIGLFERLRVAAEHRSGYDRDALFNGWLYSGGLSTRERVLRDERRSDGNWLSVYDSAVVTEAAELDIDHLVPLAEAWESGGHLWTAATWARFANDLGDPRSLIAVSASTNRSKGARDPAEWWPPDAGYRCQYAADWIAVKTRWDLAVDLAERSALESRIEQCAAGQFEFDLPQFAVDASE
ncbi:HNH endonuclease family protein [Candidatus Poriferisodalis sp.]|uniref:HNH endonuclease family protein n=1 Tax=Candidatus Poriferisodalis sp. TaxID=3101277 RepID=UPI003B02D97F